MNKTTKSPILIVGAAAEASDIRYGCGYVALDPTVYLIAGKNRYLVVPLLELGRAKKTVYRGTHVVTPQDLNLPPAQRRQISSWAYGLLKKLKLRRVTVPPSFPAGMLQQLQRKGIRIQISQERVYPGRAIKSNDEIKKIQEAQKATVAAMNAGLRIIAASAPNKKKELIYEGQPLTSERVRLEIETVLLKHQCFARDTIVACGAQAADPHDRGSGLLRAGETIVLDIFPQHKQHGYWGDLTRTVIKGQPSPTQLKMYRAVKKAQEVALKKIRAGVRVRVLHEEVQKIFEQMGFETGVKNGVARGFFHGTGHGVGLDIHEAPSISLNDDTLKAGHVVTVEPGLYYPEWGGVRIEDTVVVTKTGWRPLATCKKTFVV